MKLNIGFVLISVICLLATIYALGPKLPVQKYNDRFPALPSTLPALAAEVARLERLTPTRPGNQAEIVFDDSLRKGKTKIAVVYLHGLSASHEEGMPLHKDFAKRYHANLFLARLYDHGLRESDPLKSLTPALLYRSAVRALAIGAQLGDSVIIMGTSTGGTLALMLAARAVAPIKALILYSPCVKIFDRNAYLLDVPWGVQLARLIKGNTQVLSSETDSLSRLYWYPSYRLEGAAALQRLIVDGMTTKNFNKVSMPVLTLMYYKDTVHQDSTVDVSAIRSMFSSLAPTRKKVLESVPGAGNHVLASYIRSHDIVSVHRLTYQFADDVLALQR